MAATMHHAAHANLLDARFEEIRDGILDSYMDPVEDLFMGGTPQQLTVREGSLTPIGLWSRHSGTLDYTSPTQGYTVTAEINIFSQGLGIDRIIADFELFGLTDDYMRFLVRSGLQTREDQKVALLRELFQTTPSGYTLSEGVATISNSHTSPRAGVSTSIGFDNLIESNLTPLSLKSALTLANKLRDDAGQPTERGSFRTLVVPADLENTAMEIVKSINVPFSEENTKNILQDRFDVRVLKRLTNASRWYLFDKDNWQDHCCFLEKVKPEYGSIEHFDSWVALYRGYQNNHAFVKPGAWRHVIGGKPD